MDATFEDPTVLTERWLSSRPPRLPDHARENAALLALADEMAQRPGNVLNLLCELVLDTCNADSAGVSLLDGEKDQFVWSAVAGAWAPFVNAFMPRLASPCGKVVERDEVLIFRDVVAQFPATAQAKPEIEEILLAPFHRHGEPIGTVWAISHDPAREFDSEDRRVLCNLARFAAAAYQTTSAQQAATAAQAQLSIANRELGHRLKNVLTVVMAITAQTLKGQEDQAQVRALERRLEALGAAHKVLIEQQSPVASVKAIGRTVLETIGQADRVSMDGPEVSFGPRTALAYSLILHELGTNALKYGALSKPGGRVTLSWTLEGTEAEPLLRFCWSEAGGPPAAPPGRSGFGTRLIAMGLLGSGGTTTEYGPDGLRVEISAPMREAATF